MIEVPARFNAATFFVDRHVAEGRGDKVAFFHDEGSLTYAGLQELVNRTYSKSSAWLLTPRAGGAIQLAILPRSVTGCIRLPT